MIVDSTRRGKRFPRRADEDGAHLVRRHQPRGRRGARRRRRGVGRAAAAVVGAALGGRADRGAARRLGGGAAPAGAATRARRARARARAAARAELDLARRRAGAADRRRRGAILARAVRDGVAGDERGGVARGAQLDICAGRRRRPRELEPRAERGAVVGVARAADARGGDVERRAEDELCRLQSEAAGEAAAPPGGGAPTALWRSGLLLAAAADASAPAVWEHADAVLDVGACSRAESLGADGARSYLRVALAAGKRAQPSKHWWQTDVLPAALGFARAQLRRGRRVVVTCDDGVERAPPSPSPRSSRCTTATACPTWRRCARRRPPPPPRRRSCARASPSCRARTRRRTCRATS